VPFTSEHQLCAGELPFRGKQSSLAAVPHVERTAGIFWDFLRVHHPRFFAWNALPLHPHPVGAPFSLRRPSTSECREYRDLLSRIAEALAPRRVIAVGRVAEAAARNAGLNAVYVRHPSHGGLREFREGIESVFRDV
jgi:hypothetical protein